LGEAIALLVMHPKRCGIQEEIGNGVGQEIDLVHVKNPAIRAFKEARLRDPSAGAHERLSVYGTQETILGDSQRDIDKGSESPAAFGE
jgi:hypothetical protein